jgi:GT2 family glycosyltransferase
MPLPKVIVLTLNYNGKSLLDDCIASYLANDYPNFEMVVIDNGSSDESEEYVRSAYPRVTCIQTGKNLGYSGGFNVGLKHAFEVLKADFALITNNDVKADSKVISELVKVAQSDKMAGFVTGKVYYYDQPDILQTVGKKSDPIQWNGDHIGGHEKDMGQYEEISERVFADDIFTLVSSQLYSDTGGYDTTFFLQCEEYDWQARAKKLGYRILYAPKAKIWHKESMTLGRTSVLKSYYDSRNPLIVIMKHRSRNFYRKYHRWFLWQAVALPSIKGIIRRLDFKRAWMIWKGYFSAMEWKRKNREACFRESDIIS